MKKSEFNNLVREAMMEMLPELIEIIRENVINESYTPTNTVKQKPDLTLVRQHYQAASGGGGYDDKDFANAGPSYRAVRNAPPAPNPKAVIEGETFASGKNIMEWFAAQGGKEPIVSDFKHSQDQMDDFIAKKFGVK